MAPPRRSLYSESHDNSLHPKNTGRRRKSSQTPPIPTFEGLDNLNASFGMLPPNLSEDQRRDLRARQLVGLREQRNKKDPSPNVDPSVNLHPLPDHDIIDRDDLDVPDPRGNQGNQVDGQTVFPEVLGPQFTHTKTRILPKYAEHPPLPNFDNPLHKVNASENPTEKIAAVDAGDQTILAFDNEVTQVHMSLRRLRQKAEQMFQAIRNQDDDPGKPGSPSDHAENLVKLISTIIEPWFVVLEDEFNILLSGTEQSTSLNNPQQVRG